MGGQNKSAADIAAKLSPHKAKDVQKRETPVEEVGGGIEPEAPVVAAGSVKTGTPFDMVPGRPMVDFWGPLETYGFVTTPYGEYAIPVGKILRLEVKPVFDAKTGQNIMRPHPIYEDAPPELLEYIKPLEPVAT